MQKRLSILLLLAITWQITGRLHTILLFNMNQEKIAQTLCENKNRPSKRCHGKCVLVKELKKEAEREQKQNTSAKDQNEIVSFAENGQSKILLASCPILYPSYTSPVVSGTSRSLFHPPSLG